MKSKLLPIADLNAILLSIFLVLSLGASRGILDKNSAIPEEWTEIVLEENKPVAEDAIMRPYSYTTLLWSGQSYRYDARPRGEPTLIQRLRQPVPQQANPTQCGGFGFASRISVCHRIMQSTTEGNNAALLEDGECKALSSSVLGRALFNLVSVFQEYFDTAKEPFSSNTELADNVSVFTNDFQIAENRSIHVVSKSPVEVQIFGAICREDPQTLPRALGNLTAKCGTNPETKFVEVGNKVDNSDKLVDSFSARADTLLSNLRQAADLERHIRFGLSYSRASSDESAPGRLSLEVVGSGATPDDKPNYVLFPNKNQCESFRSGSSDLIAFVQLFALQSKGDGNPILYGLRLVN